jgi:hypothetical protein
MEVLIMIDDETSNDPPSQELASEGIVEGLKKARSEYDNTPRQGVALALEAVFSHLEAIDIPPNLVEPLFALRIALDDAQRGASNALLSVQKKGQRPPLEIAELEARAHAAAALELLIRTGDTPQLAAQTVFRAVRNWPWRGNLNLNAKVVLRWREHAMSGYPPGLVGEIAQYAERRLTYKMPNIALATGLAAVSRMNDHKAVVVAPDGRETPLNLYTLITAQTGAGKETARTVLNEIGQAIAGEDMISSSFASAQALGRELSSSTGKSLLVFQDEYGHKLAHANSGSGAHDAAVGALLLELFGLPLGSYAGRKYSKKKDDIEPAELPYVGMLAATTIEPLVDALTDRAVYDGTLNRLIYLPQPTALVRNGDLKFGEVPDGIVSAGKRLWDGSSSGAQLNSSLALPDAPNTIKIRGRLFRAIRMTDAASTELDKFDRSLDSDKQRGGPRGSLAGRATELAIRIAGVAALGCAKNLNDMKLTQVHAKFGIDLIRFSMASMLSFVDDDLGVTDPKNLVRRILAFCTESVASPEAVNIPTDREYCRQYLNKGQIPHSLIVKKFRNGITRRDRDDAIRTLVEGHDLSAVSEGVSGQTATFYRAPGGRDADE